MSALLRSMGQKSSPRAGRRGSADVPRGAVEDSSRSSSSASSKGSGSTRMGFAALGDPTSENGGTRSMLEDVLLGGCSALSSLGSQVAPRLATLAESPGGQRTNDLDTQAMPMTQSVRAVSQQVIPGVGLSTCEYLEGELSAVRAARAAERAAAGLDDGASTAGFTCELLQAEIRSLTSQPPSPYHSLPASPRHHSAAARIQAVARGRITRASRSNVEAAVAQVAVHEVDRLTQVVESYEHKILPQLMVERAVLNVELTKVRTDARMAAEASERDNQALRDQVAEVKAESDLLRSQLASARLGARAGG